MKTGTTSLQLAARSRRKQLLAHGVRYPGREVNHRKALGALMGWSVNTWARSRPLVPDRIDLGKGGVPPQKEWDDLRAEIDADPERRIFITHEFVSQVDAATAKRIVEAIGGPVHICLTLRAPGQIVPSLWAQSIRDDAQTEPFENWLRRFFGEDPDHPISERYQRAYDLAELARRWARLVGPENVTAIVVDKANPDLLTHAFESMLGLPEDTLKWSSSNRSLSAIDAELFRHVNALLRDRDASWSTFHGLVRYGAIRLGPERRKGAADESRVVLPPWAAEITDRDGKRFAEALRDSPIRVVGDLDNLTTATKTSPWRDIDSVPIDVAAEAVAGAILAGQEARSALKKDIKAQADELSTLRSELVRLKKDDPGQDPGTSEEYERLRREHETLIEAYEELRRQPVQQLSDAAHAKLTGLRRRVINVVRSGRSGR